MMYGAVNIEPKGLQREVDMTDPAALKELAPTGVLRAAINLSNPLLVTGRAANGDPQGVSPDMARCIADKLGVQVCYVTYPTPGELADAMARGEWDIGLIAVEPVRAETIYFAPAYVEIEATYLAPPGSKFTSIDEVDGRGVRIAVSARSAYDLYLTRTIKNAELVRANGLGAAFDLFQNEKLDVLAGLRPALLDDMKKMAGSSILPGRFTAVQSIGTKPGNTAGAALVRTFIENAKMSGLVASLIDKHGVTGLLTVSEPG
jgi:polar amino acid transport system substrate-binding protein